MTVSEHLPIEEMEFFKLYEEVADWVWDVVAQWSFLAQDTVGKRLIRAADSIGANLVEGDGGYTDADSLHFFVIARASARECRWWLKRAVHRKLLSAEEGSARIETLETATRWLNRLISYRRSRQRSDRVKDEAVPYLPASDPFTES
jgi:four helix bundle protein